MHCSPRRTRRGQSGKRFWRIMAAAETFIPSLPSGVLETERKLRSLSVESGVRRTKRPSSQVFCGTLRANATMRRTRGGCSIWRRVQHMPRKRSKSREDQHRAAPSARHRPRLIRRFSRCNRGMSRAPR